jgi:multidrug resistance protein MdtO
MSAVSGSLELLHAAPTPWEWLRREMAPSEERWNFTIRLVVAVVAVVVVSMALQTPLTAFSAYMAFFISKENRAITTIVGVLGCLGATIGVGSCLFIYRFTFDYPEFRLPAMAAAVFGGMWLSRVLTLGPLGFVIGFLVGLIQSIADGVPTADQLVREVLWLWVVVNLGFAITVVVNIVLLPAEPLRALERGLRQRLELTIAQLRRTLDSSLVGGDSDGALVDLASRGTASLQQDLRLAALKHPVRARATALAAAIRESDRLVVAAASLGLRDAASLPLPDRAAANGLVSILVPLARRPLDRDVSPAAAVGEDAAPTLPELRDMQRASIALRNALALRESPPAPKEKRSLFVPDAFTNKDHVRFALKVTLAAMTCYVVYSGLDWSGIRTAFITCCFVALESTGASVRKATLRLVGCAIGGAIGFLSIVYLVPHMESIVSLALVTAAVSALAGWIAAGSDRVSYAGLQIALAFFLCMYQGFAPDTHFHTIRDRFVGIVLGICVMSIVFRFVWPETATLKMRAALVRMLRGLAQLVRVPAGSSVEAAATARLRSDVSSGLNGLLRLSELAALEGDDSAGARGSSPQRARRLAEGSQQIYVTAAVLAGEAGLEDWSRLDADERAADLAARSAVAEGIGELADVAEDRSPVADAAVPARTGVLPPDTGARAALVRRLVELSEALFRHAGASPPPRVAAVRAP